MRDRHYRCERLGGAAADRRLLFTDSSHCRVEVRLLADPRPPQAAALNVRFGKLLVAVEDRRTVFARVLERLHRERDPEGLFEIDQCLRAGAELDSAVADFKARNPGADCWDLILALRYFRSWVGDAELSRCRYYWRHSLQLFSLRLQRRLLDFV